MAAHFTHHNGLLGALGRCVVGRVVAHFSGSETYDDVSGKMLGSDADLSKIANDGKVSIVRASSLKGYKANDAATQARIAGSSAVKQLDTEIAADASLNGALQSAGFKATDVISVSAKSGGVIFFRPKKAPGPSRCNSASWPEFPRTETATSPD